MESNVVERWAVSCAGGVDEADRRSSADALHELARILDRPEHLQTHWTRLQSVIAAMFNAQTRLALFADADGEPADRPGPAQGPRSEEADGPNVIRVPIRVEEASVGILQIRRESHRPAFDEQHRQTAALVALLIGKALQVSRLQSLLNSRFAQLALMQGPVEHRLEALRDVVKHPKGIGRLVARSFYREMTKAGLDSSEVISIASEIISQLTASLKARKKAEGVAVETAPGM